MSEQPEALRLADALEAWALGKPTHHREAAAELRRLHDEVRMLQEQNTEQDRVLVEMEHALNEADAIIDDDQEAYEWRKRWGYLWGREV
jgi:hypothetical protein